MIYMLTSLFFSCWPTVICQCSSRTSASDKWRLCVAYWFYFSWQVHHWCGVSGFKDIPFKCNQLFYSSCIFIFFKVAFTSLHVLACAYTEAIFLCHMIEAISMWKDIFIWYLHYRLGFFRFHLTLGLNFFLYQIFKFIVSIGLLDP